MKNERYRYDKNAHLISIKRTQKANWDIERWKVGLNAVMLNAGMLNTGMLINEMGNKDSNTANHFFFFSTPTVFPKRPVVLVCCPLTLSPHLCLQPRLHLILYILSMSSLSLVSRMLEATCKFFPSLQSLFLFKNHLGIPCPQGSAIILAMASHCFSVRTPDLIRGSILRILQMRYPNLLPTPLIFQSAKGTVLFPSILVFRIR